MNEIPNRYFCCIFIDHKIDKMIKLHLANLLFFTLLLISCSTKNKNKAVAIEKSEKNPSQTEINLSAEETYKAEGLKLDQIITSIKNDYHGDTSFLNSMSFSQKKWIEYRDAQVLMKYPINDPIRDGSAFNTCYFDYLTKLTQERIDLLIIWVDKAKEGDICSGTIKIKGN